MRISDWSSDVCSSDLAQRAPAHRRIFLLRAALDIHIGQRLVAADVDGAEDHRPVARRVEHVAIEPLLTRSEEHKSELQSLMRLSYAVFCLKTKRENVRADVSTPENKAHHLSRTTTKHKQ